ncbi:hypothetical protein B0H65DRAFT_89036 [Neurospora tetraspora]|uniref:Uncharacterized protein n=1 Tax=Neurospora tetraspora TaxID=94610 RepID=A0AAE0MTF9_9PEZI|nr:hypothetical protein B0H65DRAFT_89036 [Neurospora tetraspora]
MGSSSTLPYGNTIPPWSPFDVQRTEYVVKKRHVIPKREDRVPCFPLKTNNNPRHCNERPDGKKQLLSKVYIDLSGGSVRPESLQGIELSLAHELFARLVRVYTLSKPEIAGTLYMEWVLPSTDINGMQWLLREFNLADEYRKAFIGMLQQPNKSKPVLNRVFVEKKGGWPWGYYAGHIRQKPERILGLVIQACGIEN